MENKYQQFYNLYNGKPVEVEDPSAKDQCMDLAFAWCDFIGIPRDTIRHQFAYQVWTTPTATTKQYFDMIPNGPSNKPTVGSLVVFDKTVGPAGHISLETGKSDNINALTFDQNWSGAQYARLISHTKYTGVVGWLQPKAQTNWDDKVQQMKNALNGGGTSQAKAEAADKIFHS